MGGEWSLDSEAQFFVDNPDLSTLAFCVKRCEYSLVRSLVTGSPPLAGGFFFCGNLCSLCGLVGEGNHQRHDLSTGLGGSCGSTGNEDGEASVLGNEKAGGSGGSVRETCEGRLRDKARSAHRKGIYLTSRKLFYVPHNE